MAQTQRNVTPVENADPWSTDDFNAWREAAEARKFTPRNGGKVYDYIVRDGKVRIFQLKPMPGFAAIPAEHRQATFHARAQFAKYRIAQVVTGVSIQSAVDEYLVNGTPPKSNENDAFEEAFRAMVAERVALQKGELDSSASSEEKSKRAKLIDNTVAAQRKKDGVFDTVIQRAIEAANEVIASTGTGRKRKAAEPGESLDIDLLSDDDNNDDDNNENSGK